MTTIHTVTSFNLKEDVLDKPMILEASAGTGKTYSLQHLVLRFLVEYRGAHWEQQPFTPSQLLLVTFTEDATQELRQRINQMLEDSIKTLRRLERDESQSLHDGAFVSQMLEVWKSEPEKVGAQHVDEVLKAVLNRLVEVSTHFSEMKISTIHAYCKQLLRDHAFEAGRFTNYDFAEDLSAVIEEEVETYFRENAEVWAKDPFLTSHIETLFEHVSLMLEVPESVRTVWLEDLKAKTTTPLSMMWAFPGHQEASIETYLDSQLDTPQTEAGQAFKASVCDWLPVGYKEAVLEVTTRTIAKLRTRQLQGFSALLTDVYDQLERGSPEFAQKIRSQTKCVLIDEFQDTDPVQYSIFEKLFLSECADEYKRSERAMVMVGDPKQSIYAFRSADLATYFRANEQVKKQQGLLKQLDVNYRSSEALVKAFERLWRVYGVSYPEPEKKPSKSKKKSEPSKLELAQPPFFDLEGHLNYHRIAAGAQHIVGICERRDQAWVPLPSLSLWLGEYKGMGFAKDSRQARNTNLDRMTKTIYGLISHSQLPMDEEGAIRWCVRSDKPVEGFENLGVTVDGKPLWGRAMQARDFAVLCRSMKLSTTITQALAKYGIGTRSSQTINIKKTLEAQALLAWMRATLNPHDRWALRTLRSSLLGQESAQDWQNSLNPADDEASWRYALKEVLAQWESEGIGVAFSNFMKTTGPQGMRLKRMAQMPNGERSLSIFQTLIEFLMGKERKLSTPASLYNFFDTFLAKRKSLTMADNTEEETLEVTDAGDDDRVTLYSIHKSKGLQYPVVFIFDMEKLKGFDSKRKSTYYRTHQALTQAPLTEPDVKTALMFNLSATPSKPAASISEDVELEAFQEDARLGYVAVTRAIGHVVLMCSVRRASEKNPNKIHSEDTYLLMRWLKDYVSREGISESKDGLGPSWIAQDPVWSDWQAFPEFTHIKTVQRPSVQGKVANFLPKRGYATWTRTSFSGMHKLNADVPMMQALEPDEVEEVKELEVLDVLDFKGGREMGSFLHEILEHANRRVAKENPDNPDKPEWLDRAENRLNRYLGDKLQEYGLGKEEALKEGIRQMLYRVLSTPIFDGEEANTLGDIPDKYWIAEREFLFSVKSQEGWKAWLEKKGFHLGHLAEEAGKMEGFLSGAIDLITCYEGKWYVIDWKSNNLNRDLDRYSQASMKREMAKHGYELQALIYMVALRRHLVAWLGEEGAKNAFGGAKYIFLRGINPDNDPLTTQDHQTYMPGVWSSEMIEGMKDLDTLWETLTEFESLIQA